MRVKIITTVDPTPEDRSYTEYRVVTDGGESFDLQYGGKDSEAELKARKTFGLDIEIEWDHR